MARFYVRDTKTQEIIPNLRVADLREMAKDGRLKPNDRIRKSGHTTWHLASGVSGLEFLEVDVTSVISLQEPEVEEDKPFQNYPSDDELDTSATPPQYGTLESTRDHIEQVQSRENTTFTVRWTDNREDGPFELATIEALVADGVIQHDCMFRKEGSQSWNPISSLGIQSISNEYFVTWDDGRTDGPFNLSAIQSLVIDGFVSTTCTFKHSEGVEIIPYSAMNLLDMQAPSTQPPNIATPPQAVPVSAPTQGSTSAKPIKEKKQKKVKQKKQKKVKEPWREGWLRRLVVKSTAAIIIIGLVVGLGSWGVWTAMPESQREWATKKYESIKASITGNKSTTSTTTSTSGSAGGTTATGGVVSGGGSTPSTPSAPSGGPVGAMGGAGNISIPQYGPLWVQEELNLPVVGSYALSPSNDFNCHPMFFLISPNKTMHGRLELKALYSAEHFGKKKWFWVSKQSFISNGSGGPSDGVPEMDRLSERLFQTGDYLGIGNQDINHSNLVRSWFNLNTQHLRRYDLRDPKAYSATIVERAGGNVERISLGGLNQWSDIEFLQFDRDQVGRVTAVFLFDSRGTHSQEILRFEYAPDNTVSKFSTAISTSRKSTVDMIEWIPTYQDGKLVSIDSTNLEKKSYNVAYQYDSSGRITQISYLVTQDLQVDAEYGGGPFTEPSNPDYGGVRDGESTSDTFAVDKEETVFIATFAYQSLNKYWSNAMLSGSTTRTKIRGLGTAPEVKKEDYGMVQYEQTLK